jgi:hypothetical protein
VNPIFLLIADGNIFRLNYEKYALWFEILSDRVASVRKVIDGEYILAAPAGSSFYFDSHHDHFIALDKKVDIKTLLLRASEYIPDTGKIWIVWDLRYPDISINTFKAVYQKARQLPSPLVVLEKIPQTCHPAASTGQLGCFTKIISCFVNLNTKYDDKVEVEVADWWGNHQMDMNHLNTYFDPNSDEIGLEVDLTGIIPENQCFVAIVRGWSSEGGQVIDSRMHWWKHEPGRRSVATLRPLSGEPREDDHLNIPFSAKVETNLLFARWNLQRQIYSYQLLILGLKVEEKNLWPYPVVPDAVCGVDPKNGSLISRDTGLQINRRQDVPLLYGSMGYMCAGSYNSLMKLWVCEGEIAFEHFVVPEKETIFVEDPVSCAKYLASMDKDREYPLN